MSCSGLSNLSYWGQDGQEIPIGRLGRKVWVVADVYGGTCSRSMQMKPGVVGAATLGWKGED